MKHFLFLTICFLFCSAGSLAQAPQAFDIATFKIPEGWNKEVSEDHLQISTQDKAAGTFCLITVFRSVPATGTPKENFALAWKSIVEERMSPTAEPVMEQTKNDEGSWQLEMGYAPFENKAGKGVAILVTISGYGKMFNTMILTNSDAYDAQIRAFMESADLKTPTSNKPVTEPAPSSGPSLTSYNWKQSQNRKDAMGSYAGYSANTYQFLPNGSYTFWQVTFQNYAPKYYVEDEGGTYKVAGNTITIIPRTASYRVYRSMRQDPISQSGKLERSASTYTFKITNLNNNWTLLLSPVDGVETKRDGHFSFWLNGEKQKTYSYNSVNAAGELIR